MYSGTSEAPGSSNKTLGDGLGLESVVLYKTYNYKFSLGEALGDEGVYVTVG